MRSAGERIIFFVAGAGIGAGMVFLFGTRTGQRYRRQVARIVEDRCEQVTEAGREVLDKGKEALETGREFLEETGARIGKKLQFARK
jgi:hypothetical protein